VCGRRADSEYARFLEATLDLADAASALPRRARFGMAVAILRVCESDRVARAALTASNSQRLERAAATLELARAGLAESGQSATADLRRRRSLSLVA
jgi:hypothetical protein